MQLRINRAPLLRALGHIHSVIERRITNPILSHLLLYANEDTLSISGTDCDLEISESIPATIVTQGTTTASGRLLYEIVRKLPEGAEIHMTWQEEGNLLLQAGRAKFTLGCMPADEFPKLSDSHPKHQDSNTSDTSPEHQFQISPRDLCFLIDHTRFAISIEETRPYLNGIYYHVMKSDQEENSPLQLRAVATDGHRLARVAIPLPEGADNIPGIIVPRKTISEMRKIIDEATDPIDITLSENKIQFVCNSTIITSKLIDGTFPNYEQVIPQNNDKVLTIDVKTFSKAVDRVATISTERSRAVKLFLQTGSVTLSAINNESGSATEEIEVHYNDTPLEIGFNSRYLLDIVEQFTGEDVQFALSTSTSPVVVRKIDDSQILYVLMPMRV